MEEVKTIDSKSCKEVYVILNKLGLFYKLPEGLKEYISKNQSLSYEYDFDRDLPLIYQINNEKTKDYISYLYLKYINDSTHEKEILLNKYQQNEKLHQEKLIQKYNPDNIFKKHNKENKIEENTIQKEVALVQYKESIFKKFINKIKEIFCKK